MVIIVTLTMTPRSTTVQPKPLYTQPLTTATSEHSTMASILQFGLVISTLNINTVDDIISISLPHEV